MTSVALLIRRAQTDEEQLELGFQEEKPTERQGKPVDTVDLATGEKFYLVNARDILWETNPHTYAIVIHIANALNPIYLINDVDEHEALMNFIDWADEYQHGLLLSNEDRDEFEAEGHLGDYTGDEHGRYLAYPLMQGDMVDMAGTMGFFLIQNAIQLKFPQHLQREEGRPWREVRRDIEASVSGLVKRAQEEEEQLDLGLGQTAYNMDMDFYFRPDDKEAMSAAMDDIASMLDSILSGLPEVKAHKLTRKFIRTDKSSEGLRRGSNLYGKYHLRIVAEQPATVEITTGESALAYWMSRWQALANNVRAKYPHSVLPQIMFHNVKLSSPLKAMFKQAQEDEEQMELEFVPAPYSMDVSVPGMYEPWMKWGFGSKKPEILGQLGSREEGGSPIDPWQIFVAQTMLQELLPKIRDAYPNTGISKWKSNGTWLRATGFVLNKSDTENLTGEEVQKLRSDTYNSVNRTLSGMFTSFRRSLKERFDAMSEQELEAKAAWLSQNKKTLHEASLKKQAQEDEEQLELGLTDPYEEPVYLVGKPAHAGSIVKFKKARVLFDFLNKEADQKFNNLYDEDEVDAMLAGAADAIYYIDAGEWHYLMAISPDEHYIKNSGGDTADNYILRYTDMVEPIVKVIKQEGGDPKALFGDLLMDQDEWQEKDDKASLASIADSIRYKLPASVLRELGVEDEDSPALAEMAQNVLSYLVRTGVWEEWESSTERSSDEEPDGVHIEDDNMVIHALVQMNYLTEDIQPIKDVPPGQYQGLAGAFGPPLETEYESQTLLEFPEEGIGQRRKPKYMVQADEVARGGAPIYWSNEQGWTSNKNDADTFNALEKRNFNLPVGDEGIANVRFVRAQAQRTPSPHIISNTDYQDGYETFFVLYPNNDRWQHKVPHGPPTPEGLIERIKAMPYAAGGRAVALVRKWRDPSKDKRLERPSDRPESRPEWMTTEQLPAAVRAEAEKTIPENWGLNEEGELLWRLEQASVAELVGSLPMDWEHDEAFEEEAHKLAEEIKASGRFDPIVIGPIGIEGNHRIRAADILGVKIVPIYNYKVDTGEGQSVQALLLRAQEEQQLEFEEMKEKDYEIKVELNFSEPVNYLTALGTSRVINIGIGVALTHANIMKDVLPVLDIYPENSPNQVQKTLSTVKIALTGAQVAEVKNNINEFMRRMMLCEGFSDWANTIKDYKVWSESTSSVSAMLKRADDEEQLEMKFPAPSPVTDKRIRTTYEIITPESAEQGDVAESGWEDEEGESMEPDEGEIEDQITAVDKAVKFLRDNGVMDSSSTVFDQGVWYLDEATQDYTDGSYTTHHYHLSGFTEEEEQDIYNELFPSRRRHRPIGAMRRRSQEEEQLELGLVENLSPSMVGVEWPGSGDWWNLNYGVPFLDGTDRRRFNHELSSAVTKALRADFPEIKEVNRPVWVKPGRSVGVYIRFTPEEYGKLQEERRLHAVYEHWNLKLRNHIEAILKREVPNLLQKMNVQPLAPRAQTDEEQLELPNIGISETPFSAGIRNIQFSIRLPNGYPIPDMLLRHVQIWLRDRLQEKHPTIRFSVSVWVSAFQGEDVPKISSWNWDPDPKLLNAEMWNGVQIEWLNHVYAEFMQILRENKLPLKVESMRKRAQEDEQQLEFRLEAPPQYEFSIIVDFVKAVDHDKMLDWYLLLSQTLKDAIAAVTGKGYGSTSTRPDYPHGAEAGIPWLNVVTQPVSMSTKESQAVYRKVVDAINKLKESGHQYLPDVSVIEPANPKWIRSSVSGLIKRAQLSGVEFGITLEFKKPIDFNGFLEWRKSLTHLLKQAISETTTYKYEEISAWPTATMVGEENVRWVSFSTASLDMDDAAAEAAVARMRAYLGQLKSTDNPAVANILRDNVKYRKGEPSRQVIPKRAQKETLTPAEEFEADFNDLASHLPPGIDILEGHEEGDDAFYLSMIQVSDKKQGQGLGTQMMQTLIGLAEKHGVEIRLDTYDPAWFKHLGFKRIGPSFAAEGGAEMVYTPSKRPVRGMIQRGQEEEEQMELGFQQPAQDEIEVGTRLWVRTDERGYLDNRVRARHVVSVLKRYVKTALSQLGVVTRLDVWLDEDFHEENFLMVGIIAQVRAKKERYQTTNDLQESVNMILHHGFGRGLIEDVVIWMAERDSWQINQPGPPPRPIIGMRIRAQEEEEQLELGLGIPVPDSSNLLVVDADFRTPYSFAISGERANALRDQLAYRLAHDSPDVKFDIRVGPDMGSKFRVPYLSRFSLVHKPQDVPSGTRTEDIPLSPSPPYDEWGQYLETMFKKVCADLYPEEFGKITTAQEEEQMELGFEPHPVDYRVQVRYEDGHPGPEGLGVRWIVRVKFPNGAEAEILHVTSSSMMDEPTGHIAGILFDADGYLLDERGPYKPPLEGGYIFHVDKEDQRYDGDYHVHVTPKVMPPARDQGPVLRFFEPEGGVEAMLKRGQEEEQQEWDFTPRRVVHVKYEDGHTGAGKLTAHMKEIWVIKHTFENGWKMRLGEILGGPWVEGNYTHEVVYTLLNHRGDVYDEELVPGPLVGRYEFTVTGGGEYDGEYALQVEGKQPQGVQAMLKRADEEQTEFSFGEPPPPPKEHRVKTRVDAALSAQAFFDNGWWVAISYKAEANAMFATLYNATGYRIQRKWKALPPQGEYTFDVTGELKFDGKYVVEVVGGPVRATVKRGQEEEQMELELAPPVESDKEVVAKILMAAAEVSGEKITSIRQVYHYFMSSEKHLPYRHYEIKVFKVKVNNEIWYYPFLWEINNMQDMTRVVDNPAFVSSVWSSSIPDATASTNTATDMAWNAINGQGIFRLTYAMLKRAQEEEQPGLGFPAPEPDQRRVDVKYEDGETGEDDVAWVITATFPNGLEADIKHVEVDGGGDEDYVDAVMFDKNGNQIALGEVTGLPIEGEYHFNVDVGNPQYDGEYVVNVLPREKPRRRRRQGVQDMLRRAEEEEEQLNLSFNPPPPEVPGFPDVKVVRYKWFKDVGQIVAFTSSQSPGIMRVFYWVPVDGTTQWPIWGGVEKMLWDFPEEVPVKVRKVANEWAHEFFWENKRQAQEEEQLELKFKEAIPSGVWVSFPDSRWWEDHFNMPRHMSNNGDFRRMVTNTVRRKIKTEFRDGVLRKAHIQTMRWDSGVSGPSVSVGFTPSDWEELIKQQTEAEPNWMKPVITTWERPLGEFVEDVLRREVPGMLQQLPRPVQGLLHRAQEEEQGELGFSKAKLRLELLCGSTDVEEDHPGYFDDPGKLHPKHQELKEWAEKNNIANWFEVSIQGGTGYSDAYLYFRPSQIEDIAAALKDIGMEGDILDMTSDSGPLTKDELAKVQAVAEREGWSVNLGEAYGGQTVEAMLKRAQEDEPQELPFPPPPAPPENRMVSLAYEDGHQDHLNLDWVIEYTFSDGVVAEIRYTRNGNTEAGLYDGNGELIATDDDPPEPPDAENKAWYVFVTEEGTRYAVEVQAMAPREEEEGHVGGIFGVEGMLKRANCKT